MREKTEPEPAPAASCEIEPPSLDIAISRIKESKKLDLESSSHRKIELPASSNITSSSHHPYNPCRGRRVVEMVQQRKTANVSKDRGKIPESLSVTSLKTNNAKAQWKVPSKEKRQNYQRFNVKNINRDLIKYSSNTPTGRGSYGACYLAEYRGIQVVVKEMLEGKSVDAERRKRKVLREAEVIDNLGDHSGLPFLFGVLIEKEPYCLVLQFHGVEGQSLTLLDATNSNLLSMKEFYDIFVRICSVLEHIHSKGYLHNDNKGNNIILERDGDSYSPYVIDFGKSERITSLKAHRRHTKNYLAPEVCDGDLAPTASDYPGFYVSKISLLWQQ